MFNFFRHRTTKDKARSKRDALQEILRILAIAENTSPAQAARFSKEKPINWTDEKVDLIYKKLKLMKF